MLSQYIRFSVLLILWNVFAPLEEPLHFVLPQVDKPEDRHQIKPDGLRFQRIVHSNSSITISDARYSVICGKHGWIEGSNLFSCLVYNVYGKIYLRQVNECFVGSVDSAMSASNLCKSIVGRC